MCKSNITDWQRFYVFIPLSLVLQSEVTREADP